MNLSACTARSGFPEVVKFPTSLLTQEGNGLQDIAMLLKCVLVASNNCIKNLVFYIVLSKSSGFP
jgi:hypothetical protein